MNSGWKEFIDLATSIIALIAVIIPFLKNGKLYSRCYTFFKKNTFLSYNVGQTLISKAAEKIPHYKKTLILANNATCLK